MKFTSLIAAVALAGMTSVGAAATVLNGSFETDPGIVSQGAGGHGGGRTFSDLSGTGPSSWGIWTSGIAGWTTSSNGIEIQTQGTVGLTPDAGSYYVELDTAANSNIMQDIFLNAGTYKLAFAYSPRTSDINTNGIDFSIAGLSDTVTGPNGTHTTGAWSDIEKSFKIDTAGTYTLSFSASGASDSFGGLIDDVSISAVPLPAGILLLGTALAGLGLSRRRKG